MRRRYAGLILVLALPLTYACSGPAETDGLDPELEAAIVVYREEGAEQALPVLQKLVEKFAANGQPREEAAATHYIGECHWRLGDFDAARSHLDRALAQEIAIRDRLGQGKTTNSLGLLEWDLGHYDQAMSNFRKAGDIAREVGDKKLQGASLNNLSLVYDELGDYKTSLKQYQQVLEIYRDADFPRGLGDTLGNIGGVHLLLGRYREALGYYEQALEISEQLKSKPSMSQDHGNIALCYLGLGEVDTALEHFERAIELAKQAGMQQDEAYWMRGQGNGLIRKGQYDRGLELHQAALAIYDEVNAQAELLEALHDMGQLYLLLGDPESAEKHFRQALELARAIDLSRGITQNLIALGDLHYRRQQLQDSASRYEEARQRAAESEEQHFQAEALLRLALVHRDQQRAKDAAREIGEALAIARETGARPVEAEALFARADLNRRTGQPKQALDGFSAAETAIAKTGDPDLQWQIHFGRALAHKALGDKVAAIEELTAAVQLIESVRNRLREQRFRAGYVEDKYEVYVELVRLQLETGRTEDAFLSAERLRARNYSEQLVDRGPAVLSEGDRREETRLRERIRQLQRAVADEEGQGQPTSRQLALATLSDELMLAEREYQAFLDDRADPVADGGLHDAIPSTASIQSHLAAGEALLEYVVGSETLFVFVLTQGGVFAKSLPQGRSDLSVRISLLRDLTRRPGDDRWYKPAAALSSILIKPLHEAGWLRNVRQLYVVPHGVLNYLPFALLPQQDAGNRQLLIDRYTIAFLPTAAALLQKDRAAHLPRSLLAMAPARSKLRYAPDEARSVDALFRPHSKLLIGVGATESRFKSLAGQYRVLHLATHGFFNRLNPMLSGVELEIDDANDGMLQVHEVLDLRLDAELVTLSACETALGSGYFAEVPAGDEFIGMTRAFLAAGSESVLATLWEVDDRSSVRLMTRFYEHQQSANGSRNKVDALAMAQRELIASRELDHPYYWAPFMLVGKMSNVAGHDI